MVLIIETAIRKRQYFCDARVRDTRGYLLRVLLLLESGVEVWHMELSGVIFL
jgi:hypothetical protein